MTTFVTFGAGEPFEMHIFANGWLFIHPATAQLQVRDSVDTKYLLKIGSTRGQRTSKRSAQRCVRPGEPDLDDAWERQLQ